MPIFEAIVDDAFTVKVTENAEEVKSLLEVGFEYHMEIEGHKLLRRKKAYNGLSW